MYPLRTVAVMLTAFMVGRNHMTVKKLIAAGLTATLLVSPTLAAEIAPTPLPAGKPAGTKQADLFGMTGWTFALAVTAVTVGIVAAAGGFNSKTTTTTGTGS
jgi:hypothetical protein